MERGELIAAIERRVGRNVLLFQKIERLLRFILPYIRPGVSDDTAQWAALGSKPPLGNMVRSLINSISGDVELVAAHWQQIVNGRNRLVHHLLSDSGFKLTTEPDCRDCIAFLDRQHEAASDSLLILRSMAHEILAMLRTEVPPNEEFEQLYRKHGELLTAQGVVWLDMDNDAEQPWPERGIVQLLRMAEQEHTRINGMTPLADAGRFIRKWAPDFTPRNYGVKSLKEILTHSGQFDVEERKSSNGGGIALFYKSKPGLR